MPLRISGLSRAQFEKRLADAIESVTGNPIRKISRIRRAMTVLCHGGTGPGKNEHTLDQFFTDGAPSDQAQEERCLLVQLKTYDLALTADIMELADVDTFICASTAAYERTLEELFRAHFPDGDRILYEVMESSLVEDWVDQRVDERGSSASALWQMLRGFNHNEMQAWLLQTFGAEHLIIETDFFADVLCMNQRSVSVEAAEIRH